MPLEPDAANLYALPLDDFTRARDDLARRRRNAGDRDSAAIIKALRKPSVPAWALNQVARTQPGLVGAVRDAAAVVRRASERALAGDAGPLRTATRELTAAAGALGDAAVTHLRENGKAPSPATVDRIVATARAAALDPAVGELLADGVLVDDTEAAGFGLDTLTVGSGARVGGDTERDAGAAAAERDAGAAAEREREQERKRARRQARAKLDDDIATHERRVARAEAEVRELEARLAAALDRVDRLTGELDDLRRERDALDG